ncbi:SpoIIIAH-like family protein [Salimicrobium halophilum]|uniref:Stage III sporulation protein AH n=1 Tax=Salimicrobium halophilum TaxID=86666 RepID=A0A1G8PUI4_9BACI|nr:SpoIIIAH-like family protein [Salimicrobium halophilum]SDI96151.1 stage III sporulation protein AH [Salimicrobium halophilum]
MIKKQTVWLLTMVSLLVVLSVYYMTSPDGGEMTFLEENNWNSAEGEDPVVSKLTGDELFSSIRLEKEATRDERMEELSAVISSSSATPEEKDEALAALEREKELQAKETTMEDSIASTFDYEDVLIQSGEEAVEVSVITDQLPKSETREMMQMVAEEFGEEDVSVKYQPSK